MMNTIPPSHVNGVTAAAAPTSQHRTSALSQALTSADNSQSVLTNMTLREKNWSENHARFPLLGPG